MTENRWVKLTLRFASQRLSAERIESAIASKATITANVGDPVSARSPAAGTQKQALCIFDCPVSDDAPLDEHVKWLGEFLERHRSGIELIADQCELDVRISFSSGSGQGGFAIPSESLLALGRVKADLLVDLYPPESSDDE
jgi:hypothetical protein